MQKGDTFSTIGCWRTERNARVKISLIKSGLTRLARPERSGVGEHCVQSNELEAHSKRQRMTMIIPLNRDVAASGDDATEIEGGGGEPAQIILFPGVRYERWADEAQCDGTGHQGQQDVDSVDRDWLDI